MSELHPDDKVQALWAAIQNMEANKAQITLADYHLHVLRQMHAEAVREARK
jgi:hypothetical protein